ncbi:MAG: dTDP-4-dehydrorhamnose 3,5-epimerase [Planctomycetes bacterium]|nr:dTDP-4-dehydrorhamnose 3,5-epimerase [Planctomycetota bacterium]
MQCTPTPLPGLVLVESEPFRDERGTFARIYCREEFNRHGLNPDFVQQSLVQNRAVGIIRGLHYQAEPYAEDKLVRVVAGAVFDVAVDLRPDSPTRGQWLGVELTAENHRALYIPKGFAHGYQVLVDGTAVLYAMTAPYHPEAARGWRWNDPAFGIHWPNPAGARPNRRDAEYPDFPGWPA